MATLNTVFKEVFSEGLKDEGFVKIKGRQPYIVRVVNGEILHIITCRNEFCADRSKKAFSVLGGVATVYRPIIDLTKTPSQNISWLNKLSSFYQKPNPGGCNNEYRIKLMSFSYRRENEISMRNTMLNALEETRKNMLPVFDRAKNLSSCIEFFQVFEGFRFFAPPYDEEQECFEDQDIDFNEGLLYIQANHREDLVSTYQKAFEMKKNDIEHSNDYRNKAAEISGWKEALENARLLAINRRDKIYNNPTAYAKALEELERYRKSNIRILHTYGLSVC